MAGIYDDETGEIVVTAEERRTYESALERFIPGGADVFEIGDSLGMSAVLDGRVHSHVIAERYDDHRMETIPDGAFSAILVSVVFPEDWVEANASLIREWDSAFWREAHRVLRPVGRVVLNYWPGPVPLPEPREFSSVNADYWERLP